ncbi:MAG TPA: Rieske 2Fe-2S domain-containing protein [Thiobacillaceae bacterium]|nr:Rieske 2Fe-2S domain-containing protein [Thiobacillaceae bacterium]
MADDARVICSSAELEDGGRGVRFEVDWGGRKTPAFVVRYQGKPRAYLNRCGHVGVELDWHEGAFFDADGVYLICSTHGALYDPATGHCVAGRCNGNGLVSLDVVEENQQVYLSPPAVGEG